MELTQVHVEEPLLRNVQQRRTSCFHCLGVASFVLLLGATIFLALLHFKVIPTQEKDEFPVPEVLQIKNYLESMPQTQPMKGKRAAAHLMGKKGKNGEIAWQGISDNAFKDGSIKFAANSLEIEEDGLYFVYSQVMFTGSNCHKSQEFTHSILRKNDSDEPMVMLRSSKTVCEAKSQSSFTQPIYQGGLFKLDQGDIIFTKTSNVEYLDAFSGQVYFGILAV